MTIYEFYYDLHYFGVSGFYVLDVQKETPKTLRGDVFTSRERAKPFGRFVVQKDMIDKVRCRAYGRVCSLKVQLISDNDEDATLKAKQLFANFLAGEAQRLRS